METFKYRGHTFGVCPDKKWDGCVLSIEAEEIDETVIRVDTIGDETHQHALLRAANELIALQRQRARTTPWEVAARELAGA